MAKTRPRREPGVFLRQWVGVPAEAVHEDHGGPSPGARVPNPVALPFPELLLDGRAGGRRGRAEGDGDERRGEAMCTRRDAPTRVPSRDARGSGARARGVASRGGDGAERRGMRAEATDPADMSTVAANGVGAASGVRARRHSRCESHQLRTRHRLLTRSSVFMIFRRSRRRSRTQGTGATTVCRRPRSLSEALLLARRSDGAIMGKIRRSARPEPPRRAPPRRLRRRRCVRSVRSRHDLTSASSPTPLSTVGGCPPPRALPSSPRARILTPPPLFPAQVGFGGYSGSQNLAAAYDDASVELDTTSAAS